MDGLPYSLCVIRYNPDRVRDEAINVGVVLVVPSTKEIYHKMCFDWSRVMALFPNTVPRFHKKVLSDLCIALDKLRTRKSIESASTLVHKSWPDEGLAYYASSDRYGICKDPLLAMEDAFKRYVLI